MTSFLTVLRATLEGIQMDYAHFQKLKFLFQDLLLRIKSTEHVHGIIQYPKIVPPVPII